MRSACVVSCWCELAHELRLQAKVAKSISSHDVCTILGHPIWAVYIDHGLGIARCWILRLIVEHLDVIRADAISNTSRAGVVGLECSSVNFNRVSDREALVSSAEGLNRAEST